MSSSTFHVSLNVRDLAVTAEFLERLLGQRPARLHDDYAKFELADPPVVLSLAPTDVTAAAALNHLGFRLSGPAALVALKQRLTAAGIPFEVEESVACCHSRQSKLWVHDPAGNLWELYVLEDAGECSSEPVGGESASVVTIAAPPTAAGKIQPQPTRALPIAASKQLASWSHRLGQTIAARIDAADGSLDEVVLEGTFNDSPEAVDATRLLPEVARVLEPGGRLLVHGLTADRPLSQSPRLPGPAAAVKHVPTTQHLLAAIQAAGFIGLELTTFGETYRFEHAGAELRETRIVALRNDVSTGEQKFVIYRGPFAELRDDSGNIFRRGESTRIDAATFAWLKSSAVASQFVW